MELSNDQRGWILTCISAIACIIGALMICVDVIVRLFPRWRSFRIQDSNAFLSSSLSLSAGVMLFSALYSILPSAKDSLQKAEFSSRAAAWILISCFLGGVIGINVLSRIFHHFIPSQVVDCDHNHGQDEESTKHSHDSDQREEDSATGHMQHGSKTERASERTPLLGREGSGDVQSMIERPLNSSRSAARRSDDISSVQLEQYRRPSLQKMVTSTVSRLVSSTKVSCDEDGPCFGYTDPCGQECFKNTGARRLSKSKSATVPLLNSKRSLSTGYKDIVAPAVFSRNADGTLAKPELSVESSSDADDGFEASAVRRQSTYRTALERRSSRTPSIAEVAGETGSFTDEAHPVSSRASSIHDSLHHQHRSQHQSQHQLQHQLQHQSQDQSQDQDQHSQQQHHHHVPTNAFLTLSLQTSIAISLHKLPEGFITYATNHANPSLGFAVFLALFIHNLTEGFALALPLFLATQSRTRAMLYTLVLGGLSQPIGAGVAALWLHFSERGRGEYAPGDSAYGIMFALTAGVMASVGLSLLQEAFELTHDRKSCSNFVVVGMGILGISSALTA